MCSQIESLTSACFRAAEKCSLDVFDCNIVIGDDDDYLRENYKEEKLMRAWLHPELIEVSDD